MGRLFWWALEQRSRYPPIPLETVLNCPYGAILRRRCWGLDSRPIRIDRGDSMNHEMFPRPNDTVKPYSINNRITHYHHGWSADWLVSLVSRIFLVFIGGLLVSGATCRQGHSLCKGFEDKILVEQTDIMMIMLSFQSWLLTFSHPYMRWWP